MSIVCDEVYLPFLYTMIATFSLAIAMTLIINNFSLQLNSGPKSLQ